MKWFKKYLLPGLIFQSVIIGGGYGTGRELVEFFLTQGPKNGYFGMITTMLVWSLVMAVSFELARIGKNYNYRTFLSSLLGKGWVIYEILYLALLILAISVVGSAANKLLSELFGRIGTAGHYSYHGNNCCNRFLWWKSYRKNLVCLVYCPICRVYNPICCGLEFV